MEEPIRVTRYGREVWETPTMDRLRRVHCMCLNCGALKPEQPDNCPIAERMFQESRNHGMAHIVTRCDSWRPK